jgi:hypothetical protein
VVVASYIEVVDYIEVEEEKLRLGVVGEEVRLCERGKQQRGGAREQRRERNCAGSP